MFLAFSLSVFTVYMFVPPDRYDVRHGHLLGVALECEYLPQTLNSVLPCWAH